MADGLFVAALTVAVGCSGESGGQGGALQFDEPGSTTTTSTTIDLSSFGSDESVTPASVESGVPSSVSNVKSGGFEPIEIIVSGAGWSYWLVGDVGWS